MIRLVPVLLGLLFIFQSSEAQTKPSCESSCPVYVRAPDPVCGADGRKYYDECHAKCAGVEVVPCPTTTTRPTRIPPPKTTRPTRIPPPKTTRPTRIPPPKTTRPTRRPKLTPTTTRRPSCESSCPVYIRAPDPVCGSDGKKYYDECRAKCAGVEVVSCPTPEPCICTKIYKPVCGDGKDYGNECMARCDGAVNIVDGPCPTKKPPCLCPLIYKPVCGDGKDYGNECLARCAGAEEIVDGPCLCSCPRYYLPVCGSDGVTYSNMCFARCAGVTCTSRGPCCPKRCPVCADVYKPVCVDGEKTYKNRCMTLCLCPKPKSVVPGECPRKR